MSELGDDRDLALRVLDNRNFRIGDDIWDFGTVSKYLRACRMIPGELPSELSGLIRAYCSYVKENHHILSARFIQSIVKLVRCHAGLLGRTQATIFDVLSIIALFEFNTSETVFSDQTVFEAETKTLARILAQYTY
jgi:hypothetical protein